MINEMNHLDAVLLEDQLLLKLNRGEYCINDGTVFKANMSHVTINATDTVYKIKHTPSMLLTLSAEDGSTISAKEFGALDDIIAEGNFESLEEEFEYRQRLEKFTNNITTEYSEAYVTKEAVEVNVIGVWEDTGSRYISTPIHLGEVSFNRNKGFYRLDVYGLLCDEFHRICKEQAVFTETKSSFRFWKINGDYIHTNMFEVIGEGSVQIFSTLEEAKEEEANILKEYSGHLLKSINGDVIDRATVKKMYKQLLTAYHYADSVVTRTLTSERSKNSTKNAIQQAISMLGSDDE